MACFLFHCKIRLGTYLSNMIQGQMNSDQYRKKGCSIQGTTNCGASSEPDFIQNYFLWKHMFGNNSTIARILLPFLGKSSKTEYFTVRLTWGGGESAPSALTLSKCEYFDPLKKGLLIPVTHSGSLWLTLTPCDSLWLPVTHSGSLWLTLTLSSAQGLARSLFSS